MYELFYEDGFSTQRPAEELTPETITTFELEHSHDLTDELRLTVAGYHNRISSLITLETDAQPTPLCGTPPGTEQCVLFANSDDETLAWGAEAGLHWQPGRYLLVDLSYCLRHPERSLGRGEGRHARPHRQRAPAAAAGRWPGAAGHAATYQSARGTGEGGAENGEALLLGVGVSGELANFRYFAGVQNLLDEQYVLPVSAETSLGPVPQYGRTFTLQLTGSY